MNRPVFSLALLVLGLWCALSLGGQAHPVPDVPVRSEFGADRALTVRVEVDPRCFEEDPNTALSVLKADLALFPEERQQKLKTQAQAYIQKVVELVLDPGDHKLEPKFEFEFTTHENVPLKAAEDVVVMTGTWKTQLPPNATGYSIKALPSGSLSVLFENTVLGRKLERLQILFPGEDSYVLDLKTQKPRTPPAPVLMADAPAAGVCPTCYMTPQEGQLPLVALTLLILGGVVGWFWRGRKSRSGRV